MSKTYNQIVKSLVDVDEYVPKDTPFMYKIDKLASSSPPEYSGMSEPECYITIQLYKYDKGIKHAYGVMLEGEGSWDHIIDKLLELRTQIDVSIQQSGINNG